MANILDDIKKMRRQMESVVGQIMPPTMYLTAAQAIAMFDGGYQFDGTTVIFPSKADHDKVVAHIQSRKET